MIKEQKKEDQMGFYEKFIKRPKDFCCALAAIIVLSSVMIVTAALVRLKLGSPVIFKQERPGLNGEIFTLYKFRTMTDQRDENGNLLPDEIRLTFFGKRLRSTSLEGNDIIRQTTKSLINKGFCEVSPTHFYQGCNLISTELNTVAA